MNERNTEKDPKSAEQPEEQRATPTGTKKEAEKECAIEKRGAKGKGKPVKGEGWQITDFFRKEEEGEKGVKRAASNSPENQGKYHKGEEADEETEDMEEIKNLIAELGKKIEGVDEGLKKEMGRGQEEIRGWRKDMNDRLKKIEEEREQDKAEMKKDKERIETLEAMTYDLKKELSEIKKKQSEIIGNVIGNETSSGEQEKINREIIAKMEEEEKAKKRNNLIIKGIEGIETIGVTEKERIENWIKEKLQVETEIVRAWKIKGNIGMVGIELKNWEERNKIMKEKKKLKGTTIYIDRL